MTTESIVKPYEAHDWATSSIYLKIATRAPGKTMHVATDDERNARVTQVPIWIGVHAVGDVRRLDVNRLQFGVDRKPMETSSFQGRGSIVA